jgi:hypothetical protein
LTTKIIEIYIEDVVVKLKKLQRKHMNPNKCAFGVSAGQFLGILIHERGIEVGQNSVSATRRSFDR